MVEVAPAWKPVLMLYQIYSPTQRATLRDGLVRADRKAQYALALVRIVNGVVALVAPSVIIKHLDEAPRDSVAAVYALRLFGVRTVLMGADLITQRGQPLLHTTSQAVMIHASDTVTAAKLGISGQLQRRTAMTLTLISGINTVLATISWLANKRQVQL